MNGGAGALPREAPAGATWLLAAAFLGLAWTVYAPALNGPPISDDFGYLLNPWVVQPTAAHLIEILDPTSQATRSLNNYAPIRALVNMAEYALFGQNAYPYHVINVVLHALASLLLVSLYRSVALPWWAAVIGGTLFLLHPANVESVAWMSQVWTPLALAFGTAAVLYRRRWLLGGALFALALLTKPLAASLLAPAVLFDTASRLRARRAVAVPGDEPEPSAEGDLGWLPLWSIILTLYAVAEFATFFLSGSGAQLPMHPDTWVQLRSIIGLVGRYGVLAATTLNAAAFHQPEPAVSLLDPWWLGGLAMLALLGAATIVALRRGHDAGAFLIWTAVAFVPVSQLFPFLYPMADRYLYFMLPGLLGAALLGLRDLGARLEPATRRKAAAAGVALALGIGVLFAAGSQARARIWRSAELVLADAAAHYPNGVPAGLIRARTAASQGDVDTTLRELQRCRELGWDFYGGLLSQPFYAPLRDDPRLLAFLREMAGDRIERGRSRRWPTQLDLRDVAEAHLLRDERDQAIEVLERAIDLGGPLDADLRTQLQRLRREALRGR